jgi:HK97 family phage prohead protease
MNKTKDFNLNIKSIEENGIFSGYGAAYKNVDYGNDAIQPFAFSKSLENWKKSGYVVPVLWQHQVLEPIGSMPNLSEDDFGLKFDNASLWLEESNYARIAYKGMKAKTITGNSIGYRVLREEFNKKTGVNLLHELELLEISVVTNPMNTLARTSVVKSISDIITAGNMPSLSEFEDFLREAGFSKTQSSAIAGHGLRKLLNQRDADSDATKTLQLLTNFKI